MSLFAAHGLTANTIHIQLRFALSNATTWRVVDIDFSNVDFYTFHLLQSLTILFTRQVFGCRSGAAKHPHCQAGSSMSRMAAQRKALEEAAANALTDT